MKDLENVIPNPLKKNKTINNYYSYDYIKNYVEKFNTNENNELKISTSYYATADFSGLETSALLTTYNCTAIKSIPKQVYKLNSNFYIPAIGELSMAMENVGYINSKLINIGKKTIDLNKTFTSSTLYDQYTVWNFDMNYAKIGYTDIYEKNYVLPFYRYEQKFNDIEDLESDVVENIYNEFNLFTDLNSVPNYDYNFYDYVFYNYERNSVSYRNYKYPMNDKVFVGLPYLRHNKKDKLKFYIIIPSLIGNIDADVEHGATSGNPFFDNLKKVRPKYKEEMEHDDDEYQSGDPYSLNLKYIECIMYTFDNYLDIFELKYRETFVMSSANYNAEYINNRNDIKFTFNNLGYFSEDYCLAICFEIRYYRYTGSDFDILFRKFYYYNNFNILLSFPYTNKIKLKYNQYYTQDNLIVNSKHNTDLISKNYISLNNYKKNNNKLKFFLSDYPKEFEKSLLVNKDEPSSSFGRGQSQEEPQEEPQENMRSLNNREQQSTSEYVEIGGVKWARKNLGANNESEIGYYIQWAAFENKHYCKSNKIGNGKNFDFTNCPYYKNGYTKYYLSDKKVRLNVGEGDDLAHTLLGSHWRIPTIQEYQALISASKSYERVNGVNGIRFSNGTDSIFLPVTNYAQDDSIQYPDDGFNNNSGKKNYGYYWSRNLLADGILEENITNSDIGNAKYFTFKINEDLSNIEENPSIDKNGVYNNFPRYYGLPIRPVYDENFEDNDGSPIVNQEDIRDLRLLKFNLLFDGNAVTNNPTYEDNVNYIKQFINSQTMQCVIRTYLIDDNDYKAHGVFGVFSNNPGNIGINTISDINRKDNISLNNNSLFENDLCFYPYGAQQDIIFVKNSGYNPFKKIIIHNNTYDHVNIWFEDELKRLCTKKTRLCIKYNENFVTFASEFLEPYYIKLNIELHNDYEFGNGNSYYNIYVNNNEDIYISINEI